MLFCQSLLLVLTTHRVTLCLLNSRRFRVGGILFSSALNKEVRKERTFFRFSIDQRTSQFHEPTPTPLFQAQAHFYHREMPFTPYYLSVLSCIMHAVQKLESKVYQAKSGQAMAHAFFFSLFLLPCFPVQASSLLRPHTTLLFVYTCECVVCNIFSLHRLVLDLFFRLP